LLEKKNRTRRDKIHQEPEANLGADSNKNEIASHEKPSGMVARMGDGWNGYATGMTPERTETAEGEDCLLRMLVFGGSHKDDVGNIEVATIK
jgi:hypothetical protein